MATSKYTSQSGIYVISNVKNGKIYIGKAVDIKRRWKDHRAKLNTNSHYNSYLQNSWNKYGAKSFKFLILEYCSVEQLDEREKHYISIYKAKGLSYNLTDGGDGRLGLKHTDEAKRKIGLAHMGSKNPNFGKPMNPEVRLKFDENRKRENNPTFGKPRSEEVKAKIRAAKLGKKLSDETRAKMSEAHKGEKNHRFGVKLSEETKAKISASEKGKVISPEARAKMSESRKKRRELNE